MLVHFTDLLQKLKPWAETQVSLPSIPIWRALTSEELAKSYPNTLFFFVDGTVLKKWTSGDTKIARAEWNSKHNTSAYVFFVVVSSKGTIHCCSNVRLGSTHDHTHWKQAGMVDKLAKAYPADLSQGAFFIVVVLCIYS
jgi:hypothetical protein